MRLGRSSVLAVAMAVTVACTAQLAQPSATSQTDNSSPSSATAGTCPLIELGTPQGNRLDLSGAWEGGTGSYSIDQQASCVWWVAQDAPNDIGQDWLMAFRGRVASDFTLRGEWAFVYIGSFASRPRGEVVYKIDISENGEVEEVTLRKLSQTGPPLPVFARFPGLPELLRRVE